MKSDNKNTDNFNILDFAKAVAKGAEVNWNIAESSAPKSQQPVVHQLKSISSIVKAYEKERRSFFASNDDIDSQSQDTILSSWGPLEILEKIGEGSFGEVFRARDPRLDREVALKLFHLHRARHSQQTSEVIDEARLLARVRHQNVVSVFSAEHHDGMVGLWMEFIKGTTIENILIDQGTLGPEEAMVVGRDVCRALAALHRAGIIHRDIKARNVMREEGGRIVLMDLGVSREIGSQDSESLYGTPLYSAPEVWLRNESSFQSDIYSVGVLLFHMVTGNYPVFGNTPEDIRKAHECRQVILLRDLRPELPDNFIRLVERALDPDPTQRFVTAGQFEYALVNALGEGYQETNLPKRGRHPAQQEIIADWDTLHLDDEKALKSKTGAPKGNVWPGTRKIKTVAAIAIVMLVALGLWRVADYIDILPDETPAISSIVILPLSNLSGDPELEFLVDGLTEELIYTFSRLGDLKVISKTSAMRFKNTNKPLPIIAQELNVDAVVEGAIRFAGNRIQITAQLIDAHSDQPLWTDRFEGDIEDAIEVQYAMASAFAQEINLALSTQITDQLSSARKVDPAAYELYLRGKHLYNQCITTEDSYRAMDTFEQSIEQDPTFAPAYVYYALIYMETLLIRGYATVQEYLDAKLYAEKAIELDSQQGLAFSILGDLITSCEWNWKKAEPMYLQAIDLNPNNADVRMLYGRFLSWAGRGDESIRELERALELDPLGNFVNFYTGYAYLCAERYDDSIAQYERMFSLYPEDYWASRYMARCYVRKGDYERALSILESVEHILVPGCTYDLGCVYALTGQVEKARRELPPHLDKFENGKVGHAYPIAQIYATLGEYDLAFQYLDTCFDYRMFTLLYIYSDPYLDNLRGDPRFEEIFATVGFPGWDAEDN